MIMITQKAWEKRAPILLTTLSGSLDETFPGEVICVPNLDSIVTWCMSILGVWIRHFYLFYIHFRFACSMWSEWCGTNFVFFAPYSVRNEAKSCVVVHPSNLVETSRNLICRPLGSLITLFSVHLITDLPCSLRTITSSPSLVAAVFGVPLPSLLAPSLFSSSFPVSTWLLVSSPPRTLKWSNNHNDKEISRVRVQLCQLLSWSRWILYPLTSLYKAVSTEICGSSVSNQMNNLITASITGSAYLFPCIISQSPWVA